MRSVGKSLEDDVRFLEQCRTLRDNLRASLGVLRIRVARLNPGVRFHDHFESRLGQSWNDHRNQGYPPLPRVSLFWNADDHAISPPAQIRFGKRFILSRMFGGRKPPFAGRT